MILTKFALSCSDPIGNYNLALALAHAAQLSYAKEDSDTINDAENVESTAYQSRKLSQLELSLASQAERVISGSGKEFAKGWLLLALVQSFLQKSPQAAYAACDAGLRISPQGQYETVMLYLTRASLALREGQPTKAITPCEQALLNLAILTPKDTTRMASKLWIELLNIFLKLGWYDSANTCIEKLMEFAGSGVTSYGKGLIHESKGETMEALRAYKESLLQDFRNWRCMVRAAACLLLEAPDSEEARLYLRNALHMEPASYEAWYQLGLLHKAKGEMMQARQALTIAIRLAAVSPAISLRILLYDD